MYVCLFDDDRDAADYAECVNGLRHPPQISTDISDTLGVKVQV